MTVGFRSRRAARHDTASAFRHEVTLRLDHLRDLFAPPALDEFGGSANLPSGVERLVAELGADRPIGHIQAIIEIPSDEVSAGLEERTQDAIRRYCEARIQDVEHGRAALRHEGLGALALSGPLLALALLLTAVVNDSGLASFWRSFLGDGVLLVLSWVALWYPLDILLWYGRPLTHELHVLRAMHKMDVAIRGVD